jgi:formylglycine-generating enzyme required for sulfatase activity
MILVFKREGRLGGSPADLLDRSTKAMLERAKRTCPPEKRVDVEVLKEALAHLAFETQEREGSGAKVETVLAMAVLPQQVNLRPNWPPVPSPPDRVLDLAASAHIIEMTGDRSSLSFYHQLLQEYYAACEMLKRDPVRLEKMWRWRCWLEKDMPKWVRPEDDWDPLPPPPQTNWEETTIMAAGLAPENDDRLVKALLEVNPVLAGRCLHEGQAEVVPEIRRVVVDRLLATISNPEVALRVHIAAGEVLGHLGDPRLGVLVTIPAGAFLMGDDEDDNAKPQHEVVLPEYQIGKYPVTNTDFKEFVEAGGYTQKHWWTKTGWTLKEEENWTEPRNWGDIRFNKPNQPVVRVSWYECMAYCRWFSAETGQSCRLPSEAEWEKAARGTDGRQYPWGNEFEPQRLNTWEGDQMVGATTVVGIYPKGKSPYGCLDMAGNVWEWSSTQFRNYKYNPDDGREDPDTGDDILRVLRGGSWSYYQLDARCSDRFGGFPYDWYNLNGFRVVVSPISAL